MKKQYFFSFVLAALSFVAAKSLQEVGVEHYYYEKATNFQKEDGYFDLAAPATISNLPMGIIPFSDVSMMDSTHLVCIDSKSGGVLFYDLTLNTVSNPLELGVNRQFTDVSMIDSTLILFDADKKVHFLLPPYDSTSFIASDELQEDFNSSGICLHESTKRLFMLGELQERENGEFSCSIYAFNLNRHKLREEPLFDINTADIELFAMNNNLLLPRKITSEGDTIDGLNFKPTAMAIHPKTNEIYVLSSEDRSLVVFNQFGDIVNFTTLDATNFYKPTGMTFHKNGNLLITNSDLMHPSIVTLKWNKLLQSMESHGLIFGR